MAAQFHATPENPRIVLFCVLIGVTCKDGAENPFNPRLMTQYFLPAMRVMFPDPKQITKELTDGKGKVQYYNVTRAIIMRACLP